MSFQVRIGFDYRIEKEPISKWQEFKEKYSWIWKAAKIYFLVFAAVGFAMFICEESMQISTFGCFAYSNAKDWQGLQDHLDHVVRPITAFSKFFINWIGWLNPIMYDAYKQYLKGNEGYIESQEALIKANINQARASCSFKQLQASKCNGDDVVSFGKYKGKSVKDLPEDYFNWIQSELSPGASLT